LTSNLGGGYGLVASDDQQDIPLLLSEMLEVVLCSQATLRPHRLHYVKGVRHPVSEFDTIAGSSLGEACDCRFGFREALLGDNFGFYPLVELLRR
jgi:hypothetical protein